jgi:hypothetical protein
MTPSKQRNAEPDDLDDLEEGRESERPIVRHVVKDLRSALAMKRLQAAADERARKAEASADERARKAEASAIRARAKFELQKIRLGMSSRHAASLHLSRWAGLYMFLSVIAFLYAVETLEGELVAVTAGLITLVVTSVASLLTNIVTGKNSDEGVGMGESDEDSSL